jgi:hypothetical protein
MKYCSNCGEQMDEKAVICVKCGVPVNGGSTFTEATTQTSAPAPKKGSGAATASLVLGIIGIIAGVISVIIAVCVYFFYIGASTYDVYDYYSTYRAVDSAARIVICIAIAFLPGVLSLIGLPLGCFCRKGGPKIAGIVLNAITLVLVIVDVVLLMVL